MAGRSRPSWHSRPAAAGTTWSWLPMADFFATLVARSQGQLDSVRPRRLSRFEVEPGPLGVGEEEVVTGPGVDAPARSPSPPRAAAPRDDQQATGAPPLPPAPDAAPMSD